MKKNGSNLFSTIAFILFIIWGIGTLVNAILGIANISIGANIVALIDNLLRVCAIVVMLYCAYSFYAANKSNKLVFWLFWISVVVAIVAVVLPFFG